MSIRREQPHLGEVVKQDSNFVGTSGHLALTITFSIAFAEFAVEIVYQGTQ